MSLDLGLDALPGDRLKTVRDLQLDAALQGAMDDRLSRRGAPAPAGVPRGRLPQSDRTEDPPMKMGIPTTELAVCGMHRRLVR